MKYGKGVAAVIASVMIFSGVAMAGTDIIDSMDFVGEAKILTIEEAIKVATENSPEIDQFELNLEKSKEDFEKNQRGLKKLKKYLNNKKDAGTYLEQITIPEKSNNFAYENAQRNLDATVEKVKADVESAYYSLQQALQLESINKTNLDIAKDIHEKTKQKLELGLVAKQEVIKSELSLTQAQNQYDSAMNNAKRAQMNLNIKLGKDVMDNLKLSGELSYNKKELGSIKEAVENGLEKRNDILASKYSAEIQNLTMEVVKNQYPDITYQYKSQKLSTEKANKSYANNMKMIEMEIRSNYLDVQQKEKEIIAGQKQVELAQEGLKLTQLSYDVGMAVLTELQQAQNGLLQAQLGLSKAILDYNLAVIKYEDSIGLGTTAITM